MVFQWTVRVSQRLQSRLLQSGAFQRFGLVQIVLETSKIRGVSQTLGRQTLYMTGALAVCFDDYGDRAVQSNASTTPNTKFRTRCLASIGQFPQKSPVINSSVAEIDLTEFIYRVEKTHTMPCLHRSFSAKEPCN